MSKTIPDIEIADYTYSLPQEKIAQYPLEQRDKSKLLVYNEQGISDENFQDIASFLPENSTLVLNNTKVFYARLLFHKKTGARIEIFLLEAHHPAETQQAFEQKQSCQWKCLVGNAKKWKEEDLEQTILYNNKTITLKAKKIAPTDAGTWIIEFNWNEISFAEIIENAGNVPLPPYMNRESEEEDKERYQTVYAKNKGSVAAPTAGLHFTSDTFDALQKKGIESNQLTLHVGAGTFRPISAKTTRGHNMHTEIISISLSTLQILTKKLRNNQPLIAVGTTSLRSLESIYWYGIKLIHEETTPAFDIKQHEPYGDYHDLPAYEVFDAIINYMTRNEMTVLNGATELFIMPGYRFRTIKGIVTNFHQPASTLLLLIAAFLGDNWKSIYRHALDNNYRFLSYGDSCLFLESEMM